MITLLCQQCGNPKHVLPYRKNKFKFCSVNCKHLAMKNSKPWNTGKKYTDKQKAKLNLTGLKYGHQKGQKSHMWRGDFASYSALHYWIYRQKGKAKKCEDCGRDCRCHWANISGEYKRDVNDYKSLCPRCHFIFDKVGIKMWKTRRNPIYT